MKIQPYRATITIDHSGHDALFAMPDLDALPGVLAMRFPNPPLAPPRFF
jgi:hypothetical protein